MAHDESTFAAPSAVTARAAHADALIKAPQQRAMQTIECSKLAGLIISDADSRPLDQRAADVAQLMKEDEKCSQSLLTLSHELDVSDTASQERLSADDSAVSDLPPLCACAYQSGRLWLSDFLSPSSAATVLTSLHWTKRSSSILVNCCDDDLSPTRCTGQSKHSSRRVKRCSRTAQ